MTIATFNIDWLKNKKNEILTILSANTFDFLVLTESVDLELENYKYKYSTKGLPKDQVFETQNYATILGNKNGHRVSIYSNHPISRVFTVNDSYTNIACEFDTDFGKIVIYGLIIGTIYNRKPFAENELSNCIQDCKKIYQENQNIIIVGDLNSAFSMEDINDYKINKHTTSSLVKLFEELNLYISTIDIGRNIDHIVIPKMLKNNICKSSTFVKKGEISSDHHGVFIELS